MPCPRPAAPAPGRLLPEALTAGSLSTVPTPPHAHVQQRVCTRPRLHQRQREQGGRRGGPQPTRPGPPPGTACPHRPPAAYPAVGWATLSPTPPRVVLTLRSQGRAGASGGRTESACSWSGCSREFECQQRFRSQPLQEAVPTGAQRWSVSPSPTTGSLSSAALRDVCHPAAGPVHVPPGDGHAHALLHLPISGGGAVRSCRAEVSELQALGDASGTVSPPVTQVECREGRHKWPSDLGQPCTTKVGPGGARCTPSLLRAHPQPPSKRGVFLLSEAVFF